jgi:hypothetical protein
MSEADRIDLLSVVARQCVAVTCLERFCNKFNVSHPEISRFVDHVWKVAQVDPSTWGKWEDGFSQLAISGLGDPWPEEVLAGVPQAVRQALQNLVVHVLDTSASTWYGEALAATRRELQEVLVLCRSHEVEIPNLDLYVQPLARTHSGWGPPLTDDELKAWRALV